MIRSIPTIEIAPDPNNVRVWGASKEADEPGLGTDEDYGGGSEPLDEAA